MDSEKWTQAVNRGGLILIDDSMYQFLVSAEIEITSIHTHNASVNESLKDHAMQGIIQNEHKNCWKRITETLYNCTGVLVC